MSVSLSEEGSGQVFLLRDYKTLNRYWRVLVRQGAVVHVQEAEKGLNETVHGMLDQWTLSGQKTTMGFMSTAPHGSVPGAPGYSKNLLILVNERLLGDGLAVPRLRFQSGSIARHFSVETEDGWGLSVNYKVPWIRELIRKFNFSGTLEYDPVDFIERLVDIVRSNRPQWLLDEAGGN